MYGCSAETDRPTDRRTDGPDRPCPASRRLEATRRRPARLILNIDHVYSTQRDSLVITISTTGQHGPLASSIVPGSGPVRHGGHLPVPSVRLVAVPPDQLVGGVRPAHIVSLCCAGSFVISSNGFRSFVRRRRRVEFDESLKLTDAPLAPLSAVYPSDSQPAIVSLIRPTKRVAALALIKHQHNTDNSPAYFCENGALYGSDRSLIMKQDVLQMIDRIYA